MYDESGSGCCGGSEGAAMDVDSPTVTTPLKRSSSAPMINEAAAVSMTTSPQNPSTSRDPPTFHFGNATPTRTRRHSFSPHPGSPLMEHVRLTPRISQLRQEESVDHINQREVGHEREIRNTMRNSQSLEDLSLTESGPDSPLLNTSNLRLIIPTISSDGCNVTSPSPTRLPHSGFHSPTRGPTRAVLRRSESPVLRPSPLSHAAAAGKRKLDRLDDDSRMDCVHSPIKRHNSLIYSTNHLSSHLTSLTGGLLTTSSSSSPSTSATSLLPMLVRTVPSSSSGNPGTGTTSPHLLTTNTISTSVGGGGSLSSGVRTPDDSLSSSGAEESQFSPGGGGGGGGQQQLGAAGGDYVMMTDVKQQQQHRQLHLHQQHQDHDMT